MFLPYNNPKIWYNVFYEDYIYETIHDKINTNRKLIKIPFWTMLPSEITCIMKWIHITPMQYPINTLYPYASFIQWVAAIDSVFRTFMDNDSSIHAHELQKHRNGKNYNKTSAISKLKKNWDARDEFWNYRNAQASYNVQFLHSFFQSGGNNLEIDHANFKKWFYHWMKGDGMGLDKAIAWLNVIVLKCNSTRTSTMQNRAAELGIDSPWHEDWLDGLYKIYDQANGMTDLKDVRLSCKSNFHGYTSFDIDTELREDMHGMYMFKYVYVLLCINMYMFFYV